MLGSVGVMSVQPWRKSRQALVTDSEEAHGREEGS